MALAGFGLAFLIFASGDSAHIEESSSTTQQYTCGMHPEIVSDEPGYCPLCSMKLTPKKDGSSSVTGGIIIDPTTSQNMGVVSTKASYQGLVKKINSFGEVTYSEPHLYKINVKIDGWVEKLFADKTGLKIKKNQPLFEIYSPKLISAQEEYLNAKKQATNNPSQNTKNMLSAAKKRLSNWDISDDQIESLTDTSEIKRTMTIRSPGNGIIISKNITNGELIKPGKEIYQIADLSKVWVIAYIYEQDLSFISLDQSADISFPSLPGKSFTSTISYIAPYLNSKQQVEIRFEIDNPNYKIRPDMYAEVIINSELNGKKLVIPYSAVIHSGTKEIVYVKGEENSYLPKEVTTGTIGDEDLIEILSGLDEGDFVVTSGQFMLDSESRLNEALSKGAHVGHDHGGQSAYHKTEMSPAEMDGMSGVYTCPMPVHFDQLQYGEGNCSKCGMDLVPIEETDNTTAYICPMRECGVVANEPGQCHKCNMNLQELELDTGNKEIHHDHSIKSETSHEEQEHDPDVFVATGGHDIYTCPMPVHFDQLQYGEGNCSKCNMKLVPLEETDNKKFYVCPMTECETVQDHKGMCNVCGMNLVRYQTENKVAADAE